MCAARSDILLQSATSMKELLEAFKAARLFSPAKVQQIRPSVSALDTPSVFPFLSSQIPALKEEFPLYVAASEDIDPSYDPLQFWRQHEQSLPVSGFSLYLHGVRQRGKSF